MRVTSVRCRSGIGICQQAVAWLSVLSLTNPGVQAQAPRPERDVASFLGQILTAGERGDRRAVATHVHLPLLVHASGFRIRIDTTTDVLRHFDTIFSSAVWGALEQARNALAERRQDPRLVVAFADGATIGGGIARVRRVEGRLRIASVVLPSLERGWKAARGAPETVAFRTGEPPAIRRGILAREETETFLLYVSTGQRLSVRVTEVAGRDVIVKVFEHATGTPLDERAGIGGRVWNGRVRFTGTARISAIRQQPGGGPLPYSLVVDLR